MYEIIHQFAVLVNKTSSHANRLPQEHREIRETLLLIEEDYLTCQHERSTSIDVMNVAICPGFYTETAVRGS